MAVSHQFPFSYLETTLSLKDFDETVKKMGALLLKAISHPNYREGRGLNWLVKLLWSRRADLNRQPAHYECAALPIELHRHSGGPNGIRTRAAALKGRCPRPLDDGTPYDKCLMRATDFAYIRTSAAL